MLLNAFILLCQPHSYSDVKLKGRHLESNVEFTHIIVESPLIWDLLDYDVMVNFRKNTSKKKEERWSKPQS